MKKIKTLHMAGITDAHGIESYFPADSANLSLYVLRASLNRQRHAVCYSADVDTKTDARIKALINDGNFIGALNHLKSHAKNVRVAGTGNTAASWDLIPNPALDPFSY